MKYTEAQILDLFEKAPVPVQEVLSSQELLDVVMGFQKNYGLHTDTVGKIAELTRNLLLGITSPTEFFGELVLVGVSPDTAKQIVDELNEKIFVPVRTKMQETPTKEPTEESRPKQKTEVVSVPALDREPVVIPISQSVRQPVDPKPIVQVIAPVPIETPLPPLPPEPLSVPPAPAYVAAPAAPMRTMAHDIEAMKDGLMPAPASYTPPAPPAPPPPTVTTPTRVPEVSPAPILSAPVTPPQTVTPSHKEVVSTLKKYGIDPYHEPVE